MILSLADLGVPGMPPHCGPISFIFMQFSGNIWLNKKVLLRERKRYTALCVASTCYAALSNPDLVWGVPHPDLVGGVPHPDLVVGGTPSRPGGRGVPHPDLVRGSTPSKPGQGLPQVPPYHPDLGWGTPPTIQTWSGGTLGTPHHLDLVGGVPQVPPPSRPGMGYIPRPEMGYHPPRLGTGHPPPRPEMGYPPT